MKTMRFWMGAVAALACLPLHAGDGPPKAGRDLVIEVRDTPPDAHGGFERGADNGYTVSTGSSGDRDRNASDSGSNPGYTIATGNSSRVVHVREGERVRVDLPSVQSLQFHVPASGAKSNGSANSGVSSTSGGSANPPQASKQAPSVAGVVYFEAVSAFAARFHVQDSRVRIDLTPLAAGGVAAPFAAVEGGSRQPVFVLGHLGEWISLGDPETTLPGKSLSLTAEPPSPASVWVRVTLP